MTYYHAGGRMKKLALTVNGTDIKMNEFVSRIVTNVLTGILDSIKLDEPIKNAVFTISENSDK
jgi:hypothetical protein